MRTAFVMFIVAVQFVLAVFAVTAVVKHHRESALVAPSRFVPLCSAIESLQMGSYHAQAIAQEKLPATATTALRTRL